MGTFNDLATRALQRIGVIQSGEVLSAADAQLCLDAANALIDQWKTEELTVYKRDSATWTLSNTASYSIGTGQTINIARPGTVESIDGVTLVDTTPDPDNEIPLEQLSVDRWRLVAQKALTSAWPAAWYYEPTYPYGTLYIFPRVTGTGLQGKIYVLSPLDEFSTVSAAYSLPPAYRRMLISNLAVEVAPEFDKEPTGFLMKQATDSMAAVKRANFRPEEITFPRGSFFPGGGRSRTDFYGGR